MKHKVYFLVILIAQVVLILVMFSFYQSILNNGTEIWLKTRPVDPRDMFRGDYIQLDYQINRINDVYNSSSDGKDFTVGDTVYVPLNRESQSKFFTTNQYSIRYDKCDEYIKLCIKGKITSVTSNQNNYTKDLVLDYGINQYFIKEGTGQNLNQNTNVEVKAVVDKNSVALIKEVWKDGKNI